MKLLFKEIIFGLVCSSLLIANNSIFANDFQNNIEHMIQYNKLYEKTNLEKIKKYNEAFKQNKDWIVLKNISKTSIPNIKLWQTYECDLCYKANEALRIFKERKMIDSNYKSVNEIKIASYPIVLDKEKNAAEDYLKKALISNSLKSILSNEEFSKIDNLILKMTSENKLNIFNQESFYSFLKQQGVSTEEFERKLNDFEPMTLAFYIKKLFDEQKVKDVPMIIFNNKYVISSETISRLPQSNLIDLIEYLSIVSIMDSYGLISN